MINLFGMLAGEFQEPDQLPMSESASRTADGLPFLEALTRASAAPNSRRDVGLGREVQEVVKRSDETGSARRRFTSNLTPEIYGMGSLLPIFPDLAGIEDALHAPDLPVLSADSVQVAWIDPDFSRGGSTDALAEGPVLEEGEVSASKTEPPALWGGQVDGVQGKGTKRGLSVHSAEPLQEEAGGNAVSQGDGNGGKGVLTAFSDAPQAMHPISPSDEPVRSETPMKQKTPSIQQRIPTDERLIAKVSGKAPPPLTHGAKDGLVGKERLQPAPKPEPLLEQANGKAMPPRDGIVKNEISTAHPDTLRVHPTDGPRDGLVGKEGDGFAQKPPPTVTWDGRGGQVQEGRVDREILARDVASLLEQVNGKIVGQTNGNSEKVLQAHPGASDALRHVSRSGETPRVNGPMDRETVSLQQRISADEAPISNVPGQGSGDARKDHGEENLQKGWMEGDGSLKKTQASSFDELISRPGNESSETPHSLPSAGDHGHVDQTRAELQAPGHSASDGKSSHPEQGLFRDVVLPQLLGRAAMLVRDGKNQMHISLKPESLGHIRMEIATEKEQVILRFFAENEIVKTLIEGNANELKAELRQHGLIMTHLEAMVSGDGRERRGGFEEKAPRRTRGISGKRDVEALSSETGHVPAGIQTFRKGTNDRVDCFA